MCIAIKDQKTFIKLSSNKNALYVYALLLKRSVIDKYKIIDIEFVNNIDIDKTAFFDALKYLKELNLLVYELKNETIQFKIKRYKSEKSVINDETKQVFNDHVLLTKHEHEKLIEKYGEEVTQKSIDLLSNYVGSSGKKYKSHYHAIQLWVVDRVKEIDSSKKGDKKTALDYFLDS